MSDSPTIPPYMSVKQVAEYLHLNEKKIYELVKENQIPATKVTGKWLFPRSLIDRWLLNASHGGLMTDRLLISGSDDPLLYRVVMTYMHQVGSHALISYMPTGTRMGLQLLQAKRVDACCMHWGASEESKMRHPALLAQHHQYQQWILLHLFRREQGLMIHPDIAHDIDYPSLFQQRWRWVTRQVGAGSQRFLQDLLAKHHLDINTLNISIMAYSEREAAASVALGQADIAAGARAAATEARLHFISFGWESFDIALPRNIWFRHLFQTLLKQLTTPETQQLATLLTGYDLKDCGKLLWGED